MRWLLAIAILLAYLLPPALGQLAPRLWFHRRQPQTCHYPFLSDGQFIFFNNDSEPLLQYSIYTPWTRFYPDALRADLVEQGFKLGKWDGRNESDACGWETVAVVKKFGWHRGDVSFRHAYVRGVKSMNASTESFPHSSIAPPTSSTISAPTANASIQTQKSLAAHFVNYTRRADPPEKIHLDLNLRPSNESLQRSHNILISNSPEADILFMLLEIILPILGVVIFLTLVLLIMRHITNKLYPNTKEGRGTHAIELSSMRNTSATSHSTLVNSRKISISRTPKTVGRFPDSKYGGVLAWRLAMERPKQTKQVASPRVQDPNPNSNARAQDPYPRANADGVFGASVEQAARRQSSSTYSRSMDGVTLYPEGSWVSR